MKKKKTVVILFCVWFALAILAAILSAGAVITDYDETKNYFEKFAPIHVLSLITAGCSLIVGIAAALSVSTEELSDTPFRSNRLPSLAAIGFGLIIPTAIRYPCNPSPIITVLVIITAFSSMVYSVLSGQPDYTIKKKTVTAAFGLCTVLTCLLLNIHFYFDLSVEMNAPLKLFVQMGLLLSMLYYTAELRFLLGIPKPRLFLILGCATVSVGSLATLSIPQAMILGRLPQYDYLPAAILILSISVTVLSRIKKLLSRDPIPEESTPDTESTEQSDNSPQDSNDEI